MNQLSYDIDSTDHRYRPLILIIHLNYLVTVAYHSSLVLNAVLDEFRRWMRNVMNAEKILETSDSH